MTKEEFIKFVKAKKSAPFLFLGSGFTKHYLNTPTWEELLAHFSDSPINMYRSLLDTSNLSIIASKIADEKTIDFWKTVKRNPDAVECQYMKDVVGKNDYLKILISNYLSSYSYDSIPVKYRDELEFLAKLNIDGVITTNWDVLAEKVFTTFKVFVGQEDLIFSNTFNIAEIFKIHGSITNPKSLVLTKEDYDRFNSKNAYLAAKLITIFIEHPIIFLGYSINDSNIQKILESIVSCFDDDCSKIERFRDNLIFVEWTPNMTTDIKISTHTMLVNGISLPCIRVLTHEYMPVYECLKFYEREIPASVLRAYKEKFYNIVYSEKPEKQIYAIEAKDIDNNKDVEFVCGFGAIRKYMSNVGYIGLTANEIYKDAVSDENTYDSEKVLLEVLPRLRKRSIKYLPCYKYLNQLGIVSCDTLRNNSYGINLDLCDVSDFQKYSFFTDEEKEKSLQQIELDYKEKQRWRAFALIPYIDYEKIDLTELQGFILRNLDFLLSAQISGAKKTYFRKLVCFYDWCKYGKWFRK